MLPQIERGVHSVPELCRIKSSSITAAPAEGEEQVAKVGQGRPHRDVERWERRAVELRHGLLLQRICGRGLTCVMIVALGWSIRIKSETLSILTISW